MIKNFSDYFESLPQQQKSIVLDCMIQRIVESVTEKAKNAPVEEKRKLLAVITDHIKGIDNRLKLINNYIDNFIMGVIPDDKAKD